MKGLELISESDVASSDLQKLLATLMSHISKSNIGQKIRMDDFKRADVDGKGYCSLDDLEVFFHYLLERAHGPKESKHLMKVYQSCYEIAFVKAKALVPSRTENMITIAEFRAFLVYLCIIATMFDSFVKVCAVEDASRDDLMLIQSQFILKYKQGQGYGLTLLEKIHNDNEAKETFERYFTDLNAKGDISFEHWVESIIKAEPSDTEIGQFLKVKAKPSVGKEHPDDGSTTLSSQTISSPSLTMTTPQSFNKMDKRITPNYQPCLQSSSKSIQENLTIKVDQLDTESTSPSIRSTRSSKRSSPIKSPVQSPAHLSNLSSIFSYGKSASINLKDFLTVLKPYTEKTLDGQKLRVVAFNSADRIGYGYCSLSDMENFLLTLSSSKADNINKYFQPIFQLAYDKAKPLDRMGDLDYIMFAEFRVFIIFVCIYAKMLEVFYKAINEKNNNRNPAVLPKANFLKNYLQLHNYGFIALNNLCTEEDASALFDIIDIHATGAVVFTDFMSFLERTEIKMKTDLGQFLDAMKEQQLQSEKTALLSLSISQSLSISPTNSTSSSPIKISSIFTLGAVASHYLKNFVLPFTPYTDKTIEGQKLRVAGFKEIDAQGNGQCSMMELENFVKKVLDRTYEASQADYLFHFFRPSYPRAFLKAKSLNPSLMINDVITVTEFRVFNAYLCIFSAMYDAFYKLTACEDGEVSKTVCLRDFIDRYKEIKGYGFAALDDIRTKVEAREFFEDMDELGGDAVVFDTFCSFLEEGEKRQMTSFGDLLGGAIKSTPTFSPPARLLMRGK